MNCSAFSVQNHANVIRSLALDLLQKRRGIMDSTGRVRHLVRLDQRLVCRPQSKRAAGILEVEPISTLSIAIDQEEPATDLLLQVGREQSALRKVHD